LTEAMSRYGSHKHYDAVLNQLLAGIDANR
jgi:hypothetical protein